MSLHILNIVVFTRKGERKLIFPPENINVSGGDSITARTALVGIVDYCLGRGDFPEVAGVDRDAVAWYVARLQADTRHIVIGRPTPFDGKSSSAVFLQVGDNAGIPDYSDLKPNGDTSALSTLVTEMVGANASVSWAAAYNLRNFSVALADVKTLNVGSGVLVGIEGRLFVATAAHVIPRQPQSRLSFVFRRNTPIQAGAISIVRHGKSESSWPDVGYLEVDPEKTLAMLEKDALSIDRINSSGYGDSAQRCFLYGYPSDMILRRQAGNFQYSTFRPMCYSNVPLKPESWPSVSSTDRPPDAAVDIFVPYDPDEEMWPYEENEGNGALAEPGGTSGGGLWQSRPCAGGVWSAERIALFGIQSSWSEKKKYIRACQIIHWLRLVRNDYDDLAATLVRAFPELG